MLTYLKALLFDEGRFVSLFRAALMGAGALAASNPDALSALPHWTGPVLMAASVTLRSDAGKS